MPSFFDLLSSEWQKGKKDLVRQKRIAEELVRGEDVTPEAPEPSDPSSTFSKRGMARLLGRGSANMLPSVTASLGGAGAGALGGPVGSMIGAALAGGSSSAAQTYLDSYNEALLAGKTKEEADSHAKKAAAISGSVNSVLSAVPFGGGAVRGILKPFMKDTAIQAAGNVGEHLAQQTLRKADIDPDINPFEGAGEAAIGGAIMRSPLIAAGMVKKSFRQDVGKIPHESPELSQSVNADINYEILQKAKELALAPPEAPTSAFENLSIQKVRDLNPILQDKIFDDLTGIRFLTGGRESENKAYRMARFARHFDGVFDASLNEGTPTWNKGQGIIELRPESRGLLKIMEPVLSSFEAKSNFELYAYARRVKTQKLIEAKKEFNLSPQMVEEALKLEKAHPQFKEIFNDIQNYQKSVLDIAEETGLINQKKRMLWEKDDYVPFYRDLSLPEDQLIKNTPGEPKKSLAGQEQKIHALTGGKKQYAIFDDEDSYMGRQMSPSKIPGYTSILAGDPSKHITRNIFQNTSDLLQRSMRNAAALETVGQAVEGKIAQKVQRKDAFHRDSLKENVVKVKEKGEDAYYKIDDPLLYSALTASGSNPKEFGGVHNLAKRWSKIYSSSIVLTPKTMAKIAVKDFILSRMMGRDTAIPFREAMGNIKSAYDHVFQNKSDPRIQAMMAMGAGEAFTGIRTPEKAIKSINNDLKDHNAVLLAGKSFVGFMDKYRKLGQAGELSSRLNRFDAAKRAGLSDAASGFESLDYMDYRMRGSSDMLRLFTEITPFMSAHLASLHKVGREISASPSFKNRTLRSAAGVGIVAALNSIVNLSNDDPEDANGYKSLPDYIKYSNLCIDLNKWIGKEAVDAYELPRHLLIPKPWELGQLAMGVPEQFVRLLMQDSDKAETLNYLAKVVTGTFALDPGIGHPLVKTGIESYMGKKFFTGHDIVPKRYEKMPQNIKTPYQLEHVFEGLLGPLYSFPLMLFGPQRDIQALPHEWFTLPKTLNRTSYETEFYDLYRETLEAKVYMSAVKRGKLKATPSEIQEFAKEKGHLLPRWKPLKNNKDNLNKIDEAIKIIKEESGDEKQIERLRMAKNSILKQTMRALK